MNTVFDMVAKTFQGLEPVLADELAALGATDIAAGKRMVSFRGDMEMLYKANMCCRTALRILKPFYAFDADSTDALYDAVKSFAWESIMTADSSFAIDTVAFSDEFRNSQFVTYRVKDAIVDRFRDRSDGTKRPRVSLESADVLINVHIAGTHVTLSLDSSGESLHKRGWRTAQTEAPINEVLAAGIILMTGWRGESPFVDPMCGSGTFAIEAAMIAAGINPGIYRKHFAFETWPDFDPELLEKIYNDDSAERIPQFPIYASDIALKAVDIARENAKHAGVEQYITFAVKPVEEWTQAPKPAGVLVTNPPYGRRIGSDNMNALYHSIGSILKRVFTGYHAWIIGYEDVYFHEIGLAPSRKVAVNNGGLDCELREYVIFEGNKRDFRAAGGKIKDEQRQPTRKRDERPKRPAGASGTRKPVRTTDRDSRKPMRPTDKDSRKPVRRQSPETDDNTRSRRPLFITGKGPSISAEKEIIVNRPVWRKRKKDSDSQNDN